MTEPLLEFEKPLLEFEKVTKSYRGKAVLSLEKAEVDDGDAVLISGSNGSGKSTLLKIAAGLVSPTSGRILRSNQWKKSSIGYLPQHGGVYPDRTVSQNASIFQLLLGAPSKERASFDADVRLGVKPFLDKPLASLSGGYRRLSTLYCILNSGADVLMLDEPLASLDHSKQQAVALLLSDIRPTLRLLMLSEHQENFASVDLIHGLRSIELGAQ